MHFGLSHLLLLLDGIHRFLVLRYQAWMANPSPGSAQFRQLHEAFTLVQRGWGLILVLRTKTLFNLTHITIQFRSNTEGITNQFFEELDTSSNRT